MHAWVFKCITRKSRKVRFGSITCTKLIGRPVDVLVKLSQTVCVCGERYTLKWSKKLVLEFMTILLIYAKDEWRADAVRNVYLFAAHVIFHPHYYNTQCCLQNNSQFSLRNLFYYVILSQSITTKSFNDLTDVYILQLRRKLA